MDGRLRAAGGRARDTRRLCGAATAEAVGGGGEEKGFRGQIERGSKAELPIFWTETRRVRSFGMGWHILLVGWGVGGDRPGTAQIGMHGARLGKRDDAHHQQVTRGSCADCQAHPKLGQPG